MRVPLRSQRVLTAGASNNWELPIPQGKYVLEHVQVHTEYTANQPPDGWCTVHLDVSGTTVPIIYRDLFSKAHPNVQDWPKIEVEYGDKLRAYVDMPTYGNTATLTALLRQVG